jgi:serine/threonine protein kinase
MHEQEVMHHDIKPENIRLDGSRDGRLLSFYISDFGLVTSQDSLEGLAGAIAYMAPECTRYRECGTATDVYSFGIMILEIQGKYCPEKANLARTPGGRSSRRVVYGNTRITSTAIQPQDPSYPISRTPTPASSLQILRSCMKGILDDNPKYRFSAAKARRELLAVYSGQPPKQAMRRQPAGRRINIPIR